ncbi:hypothetical protein XCCB100_1207 [Xanthomonas campestris pv. campestris]|uniref:Uncharacterized protein n=1 Tax=Xanthomonas campestris pv. campestris (strain B100) TaxID=509169 RepID=B0RQ20_XANCB|nr:hypothetical protein XCCB100_1207 [Xanthomonas campestris pv. campestris]
MAADCRCLRGVALLSDFVRVSLRMFGARCALLRVPLPTPQASTTERSFDIAAPCRSY